VKVVSPAVKALFVALCMLKLVSLLELSAQVKVAVGGSVLRADAAATRFEGATGAAVVTITVFDGRE